MKRIIAILLCAAMLAALCGCAGGGPDTTVPSTTLPSASDVYTEAAAKLAGLQDVELVISYTEDMDVGVDHFQTTSKQTLTLLGMGTDAFCASSKETLFSGDMTVTAKEVYHSGTLYTQINTYIYKTETTADEYLEYELPLMLVDASLYDTVTQEADGSFTFTDAAILEDWCDTPYAELKSVTATATLGEDGLPSKYTYEASYTQGAADMKLSVTMEIKTPEATEITAPANADKYLAVEQDENGMTMADITAQLYLIEGYLNQATSIVSTSTDYTLCQAWPFIDNTVFTMALYGKDKDTIASFSTTQQTADYANKENTTFEMTEIFLDGTLTTVIDGGEPKNNPGVTDVHIRNYADGELMYLFPTASNITDYTLTVIGDTALLEYTFSDDFAEIVEFYNCDFYFEDSRFLRGFASDYEFTECSGYIGIDLTTGLPLSMGQSFSMTHTIEGQDFIFSVENKLSLKLGAKDAYETITGEPLPPEEPEELAKPVFYKVTGANGETMWLLGTIHVGDERTAFLPQEIYDAFAASDALALEFDMDSYTNSLMEDEEAIQAYMNAFLYTDGTFLKDHLSDEPLYENTIKLLKATGNYDPNMTDLIRPVFQEQTITSFYMTNGYRLSSDFGVDMQLQEMAQEQEKEILSVESGEFQMDMLSDLSEPLQELLLKDTLEYGQFYYNYGTLELFEMWCRGDEAELRQYLNEEDDDSELTEEEKLLYEEYENALGGMRNVDMLAVAQEYLNSGKTVFYAVGLAHLLSDDGLVNTLRDAGYTVELVAYAG